MSSVLTATATAIMPTASAASKPPAQAGIFESLNPTKYNPSDPIVLFIIQASIVIALTRLLYWPLGKIRQPPVIAEVLTGIILGPSIMGRIPGFTKTVFPAQSMPVFSLAANIGLIFYLFLVGLEIDLRFLISNWRTATSVASLDMCIPFGMGYALAYGIYNEFADEPGTKHIEFATFGLFVAVATAITAFPVLCRILSSLNLLNANVGVITLTSGIANDVIGWVLLALCVTLVNAGNGISALWVLLVAIGYALFLAFAVRPAFMWVLRKTHSLENGPTQGVVALTVFMVLCSSFFTSIIGAHSVFGAFMIGLVCPHEGGFAIKLTEKLEDLIATLFLPLFFARSGLATNLGLLDNGTTWGYVIAIIVVAFCSKVFGGSMGARLNGLVWRESLTIGVLMSCKGLVELIVLNIGLQAKILSTRTFTMFVVMALVTTFATTPLVSWLYPPSYQRKLELWRQGKIDWDGNALEPEDAESAPEFSKKLRTADRLLVYLRADGLSSLFSIIDLFTGVALPISRFEPEAAALKPEKGGFTTSLRESARRHAPAEKQTQSRRLRIHALRLHELDTRESSVMQVSEADSSFAGNDPIIKAFGSLAHTTRTGNVLISGYAATVPTESYAETLTTKASNTHSDLILVPWSETGALSEAPSLPVAANAIKDPLANREFARLAEELFTAAERVSSVGIYIDRTLFKSAHPTSRALKGTSIITDDGEGDAVTYSSTSSGKTHLHVFYGSTADELFAVKLSMQLAQNSSVHLTITKLAPSPSVSSEDAHVRDTMFDDLKNHGATLAANPVISNIVEAAAPSNEFLTAAASSSLGNTVFLVGRSASHGSDADISRVRSGDVGRTLGVIASEIISKIKASVVDASVLVVQSKVDQQTTSGPMLGN